jgi:RNA polymerase sigma factor (TIGR02999 family)
VSRLPPKTVSELPANWQAGDDEALRAVVPLVDDELRRLAHHCLPKERSDDTLQSAALEHETYLRLEKHGAGQFQNREHFVAVCAQMMRHIPVDYARSRKAAKRDGGCRLTLDEGLVFKTRSVDVAVLDHALEELAKLDPQRSRIVELRFFGGLSIEQTSLALNLSPRAVKRHWATARLWLHHEMSKATDA